MQNKKKVGLIGYGHWGKNLLRNLIENKNVEVVGVVDREAQRLTELRTSYPQTTGFTNISDLLTINELDAVIIATPPANHFELTQLCLNNDLHVMVEKPMALSSVDCQQLIEQAEKKNLVLAVDHTYVYQPAIAHLRSIIAKGELGNLLYFDSVRVNLGGFQPEVNVLWDLAPHDLSILDVILSGKSPLKVFASGVKHFGSDVENLCYATLFYDNGFIAHLHLNWAAPVKSRKIMIGGDKKMVVYDDNQPLEKIKVYEQTVDLNANSKKDFTANYRIGEMHSPVILIREPLAELVSDFVRQIQKHDTNSSNCLLLSNGKLGRRVVVVLEALTESMSSGQVISL